MDFWTVCLAAFLGCTAASVLLVVVMMLFTKRIAHYMQAHVDEVQFENERDSETDPVVMKKLRQIARESRN